MANVAGYNIETPQEVLARLRSRREEMLASGNPLAIQQAIFGNAIDALFGNPEVKRAEQMARSLVDAEQSVTETGDELTDRIAYLKAARDRVQDLDPRLADQVRAELVQLESERLERESLLADDERKRRLDARQTSETESELLTEAQQREERGAEFETWRNPGTGQRIAVNNLDLETKQQLAAQGWVKGEGTESEAQAAFGLTKPTVNDLQTAIVNSDNIIGSFQNLGKKFDPRWLQLPTQLMEKGITAAERAGLKIPAEQAAMVMDYNDFKAQATAALNNYIRAITGAASALYEQERILKGFPSPDDGPTKFLAKSRATVREALAVRKRATTMLAAGQAPVGEQWGAIPLPDVSEAEVDAVMNQIFGAQSPSAPKGTSDDELIKRYSGGQ